MRSVVRTAAAPGNLHPDGAIRCPFGFHSLTTDENDRVEVRVRGLVRGDQLAKLPLEVQKELGHAFQAVLNDAGIEVTDAETVVFPPHHDCNDLIAAEEADRL